MNKLNLSKKFSLFSGHWQPKIIGELNDSYVKIAKIKGEFVWHDHKDEDELFLIHKGTLLIKFRGEDVTLEAGEMLIIPKGVEHKPIAAEEVELILIEPKTTINTGDAESDLTSKPEWI